MQKLWGISFCFALKSLVMQDLSVLTKFTNLNGVN